MFPEPLVNPSSDQYVRTLDTAPDAGVQLRITAPFPAVQTGALTLVALCANGPRQRQALQPLAAFWEDLPPGTFKKAETNVNVALVVIRDVRNLAEAHH